MCVVATALEIKCPCSAFQSFSYSFSLVNLNNSKTVQCNVTGHYSARVSNTGLKLKLEKLEATNTADATALQRHQDPMRQMFTSTQIELKGHSASLYKQIT